MLDSGDGWLFDIYDLVLFFLPVSSEYLYIHVQ
jgi:hypothetical protein